MPVWPGSSATNQDLASAIPTQAAALDRGRLLTLGPRGTQSCWPQPMGTLLHVKVT